MFSEQQQPASVLGQKRDADEIAQFGSQEQQYANNNMMDMQAAAAAQHPGFKRRMTDAMQEGNSVNMMDSGDPNANSSAFHAFDPSAHEQLQQQQMMQANFFAGHPERPKHSLHKLSVSSFASAASSGNNPFATGQNSSMNSPAASTFSAYTNGSNGAGLASQFNEGMNGFPFNPNAVSHAEGYPAFQQDSPDHMLDMDETLDATQTQMPTMNADGAFEALHDHQTADQRWHPLNSGMDDAGQRQYYDSYNGGIWEIDEDAMAARYAGNNEWRIDGSNCVSVPAITAWKHSNMRTQ